MGSAVGGGPRVCGDAWCLPCGRQALREQVAVTNTGCSVSREQDGFLQTSEYIEDSQCGVSVGLAANF